VVNIVVLAGGVGGAKFLLGVKAALGWQPFGDSPVGASDQITAVVNTADDVTLNGLRICPDLDSCMYTLSGSADLARGWGQADETWTVSSELRRYGGDAPWFSLGDKDIATHITRSRLLAEGHPLSAATALLCKKRPTGVKLLPMTDQPVTTVVEINHGEPDEETIRLSTPSAVAADTGLRDLHFQEWWVRYKAALPPRTIKTKGADQATPSPGVLRAISEADLVLIAPSNPVVSIRTILEIPGIRNGLRESAAPVIGVSPIVQGAPVRGHADVCLAAIGVPCTAAGVGSFYGARFDGGILDGFLVAPGDKFELKGMHVLEAPLMMTDPEATRHIVQRCIELADLPGRQIG
jgi:LPPG:FO 2-phospho-L-lactate transferase